jgi:hypothetical protein
VSDIATALVLDVLVLSVSGTVLVMGGRLSAFHPGPIYLFFHFYTVTLRLLALTLGAPPLLMPQPASLSEIIPAAYTFDAALLGAVCVWLHLANTESRRPGRVPERRGPVALLLDPPVVRIVAWITILIGIVGLRYLRFSGSATIEENYATLAGWDRSTWVMQIVTWALQGSLMLLYVTSVRPLLKILIVALFVVTMFSTARYVLVVWGLFACFMFLSSKQLRWPPFRFALGVFCIGMIWFPLKVITASVWAGADASMVASNVGDYFAEAEAGGGTGDTTFLDQAAVTMTLVDDHGRFFYGGTLLPLFVLPVPRVWWPGKPHMNEYQHIIATPARPINLYGAIATIVGEGYANFGYVGGVLFPIIAAYLYGRWYFAAMRRPHNSVFRFLYLVVAATLIQVYRDGFVSAILFPCSATMPMMALGLIHWASWSVRRTSARAAETIDHSRNLALQRVAAGYGRRSW